MSFDWFEYLILAQELAGKTTIPASQEAKLRCAISRAYYAAFIKARNFLRERNISTIPRENAHHYVISQFRNSTDGGRRILGEKLQRLRTIRNQADYNDIVTGLAGKSQEALGLSRRILSGLGSL